MPLSRAARLASRDALTRLELTGSPEKELAYYRDAREFLAQPDHSWAQYTVDCHGRTPDDIVEGILAQLAADPVPEFL